MRLTIDLEYRLVAATHNPKSQIKMERQSSLYQYQAKHWKLTEGSLPILAVQHTSRN